MRAHPNLTDGSEKPLGEWNTMVIEARGDTVTVWVNGTLVNRGHGATASQAASRCRPKGTEWSSGGSRSAAGEEVTGGR